MPSTWGKPKFEDRHLRKRTRETTQLDIYVYLCLYPISCIYTYVPQSKTYTYYKYIYIYDIQSVYISHPLSLSLALSRSTSCFFMWEFGCTQALLSTSGGGWDEEPRLQRGMQGEYDRRGMKAAKPKHRWSEDDDKAYKGIMTLEFSSNFKKRFVKGAFS